MTKDEVEELSYDDLMELLGWLLEEFVRRGWQVQTIYGEDGSAVAFAKHP